MDEVAEREYRHQETLKGLLARGGAALTLAVVAHSKIIEDRGREPWQVLSPEIVAAAEQAYAALAVDPDPALLALALQSALCRRPMTALPEWMAPITREPACVSYLGRHVQDSKLTPALGRLRSASSDREKGLAALALALCRRQDTLRTLASRLPETTDARLLTRMGLLAYVLAVPGEPSAMRGEVRKLIKGAASWDV